MNAVLSGETAIRELLSGQPEPIALTTSIVIISAGAGAGAARAGVGTPSAASAARAAVVRRDIVEPPLSRMETERGKTIFRRRHRFPPGLTVFTVIV
ncbi:hypothetical protein Asi03nite_15640 [Actinoplanes siamensis]|uniref:Uncharacterized protein n=1 Tax=Actinoplanes siamensis TaxID=1223317 RepID=A0A919THP2_9ACTN|nr:hypothetical protein Asi03nite_15640 [Actinoplanes siamensis]